MKQKQEIKSSSVKEDQADWTTRVDTVPIKEEADEEREQRKEGSTPNSSRTVGSKRGINPLMQKILLEQNSIFRPFPKAILRPSPVVVGPQNNAIDNRRGFQTEAKKHQIFAPIVCDVPNGLNSSNQDPPTTDPDREAI